MGSTLYAEERRIASLAVQHASLLTKSVMRSIKHVSKKDSTPVTVADFAVQALLISTLSQAFPTDSFLGEESAAVLREDAVLCQQVWELVSSSRSFQDAKSRTTALVQPSSPEKMLDLIDRGGLGTGGRQRRAWIMDPIDGTATFIESGQYAVAVALIEDGKEVLGVVGCPNLALDMEHLESVPTDDHGYGFIVSATRGERGILVQPISHGDLPPGQFIPSRPSQSQAEAPASYPVADWNFVDSVLGEEYHLHQAKKLTKSLGCKNFPTAEIWPTQIRLIVMALGSRNNVQVRLPPPKADGGEEDPENYIWDYAGAHLILQESGGATSDLNGREIDFGTGRRLSSNWGLAAASRPELQAHLLSQMREFLSPEK